VIISRLLLTAGILAMSSVASAQQTKFDLNCTGKMMHRQIGKSGDFVPWKGTLRVDLDAGFFCWADCSTTEEIVRVGPEVLMLREGGAGGTRDRLTVNRRTGELRRFLVKVGAGINSPGEFTETYEAICEPATFSGFPETKF
jgi:hypothetical protein